MSYGIRVSTSEGLNDLSNFRSLRSIFSTNVTVRNSGTAWLPTGLNPDTAVVAFSGSASDTTGFTVSLLRDGGGDSYLSWHFYETSGGTWNLVTDNASVSIVVCALEVD